MAKNEEYWEQIDELALAGMRLVWPDVCSLRAQLNACEQAHGVFQAMHIEAQRHLVKLPIKETKRAAKVSSLIEQLKGMGKDEKARLARVLEGSE